MYDTIVYLRYYLPANVMTDSLAFFFGRKIFFAVTELNCLIQKRSNDTYPTHFFASFFEITMKTQLDFLLKNCKITKGTITGPHNRSRIKVIRDYNSFKLKNRSFIKRSNKSLKKIILSFHVMPIITPMTMNRKAK